MKRPNDRIIDRDIEFYEAEVEECERRLRSAIPANEPYWFKRTDAARKLLIALRAYRYAMENGQ